MNGKRIGILISFYFLSFHLTAQHNNIFTNFRSNLKRADQYFHYNHYEAAIVLYKKVLEKESENNDVKLKIAHSYRMLNNPEETAIWYEKVMIFPAYVKPMDKLYYAEALLSSGKVEEAKKWFHEYSIEDALLDSTHRKNDALFNVLEEYKDSLNYTVKEASINSTESDFSPAYYDKGIVFLSARKETKIIKNMSAAGNVHFLDLYYSEFTGTDSLSAPVKFDKNLNTKFHEGPVAFYDKGSKIIFTRNNYSGGKTVKSSHGVNHLVLFFAVKDTVSDEWKNISDLPFNSPEFSTSHPTFSHNNKTLYFVSDRPGGYGGTDIYESNFKNGSWTEPRNLGKEINTEGQEMFPYIYKDSILFFSSNGHPGLGGLDVYSAHLNNGEVHEVKSFSYPINSNSDDFGLIMSEDAESGYFSSNRKNGTGHDDIYYFRINSIKLDGIIEDKFEDKPLKGVSIRLVEKGVPDEVQLSGEDGKFSYTLKPGREYLIKIKHEDYKESQLSLSTKEHTEKGAHITKIFLLDKKNKSYVKGIVKDSAGNLVKDCKVRIRHKGGQEHSYVTDEKGEIRCEIDGDLENVFIAEKDGKTGIERLKVQKRRKGSAVVVVDMNLESVRSYKIEGNLKNEKTGLPLTGYEILIRNVVTEEEFLLCSDEKGRFNFNGSSNGNYSIVSYYGVKKGIFEGIKPYKDVSLEIFWSGK
jgi:tetratricopeptide (TPR) repeat protein